MENITTGIPIDQAVISSVYSQLTDSWNKMDSVVFAGLFAEDGSIVGFDGSQANSRKEIQEHLAGIFKDHEPAQFVTIIKEIRSISPLVVLLRAVAGMVPRGETVINPETNAIQSLVAIKKDEHYEIALFQNTPAAFHSHPELAAQLTKELQQKAGYLGAKAV
ncbi:MAG TPA: SgcJ/EcaC family oxidoreductase [Chitinophagaceae bacterium]|jgi:uncharacterized protein (TIGR02246 family)|nr:SgcJ/EcaC family oxidoreductase [Chitinophagaceae bacterium]